MLWRLARWRAPQAGGDERARAVASHAHVCHRLNGVGAMLSPTGSAREHCHAAENKNGLFMVNYTILRTLTPNPSP